MLMLYLPSWSSVDHGRICCLRRLASRRLAANQSLEDPEGSRGSTSRGTYLENLPWGWELNGLPKVENSISSDTQGLPAHHNELYKAWMYSLPTNLLIYRWAIGIFFLVSRTSLLLVLNICKKNYPFTHSFNKYSQNVYRILYYIY